MLHGIDVNGYTTLEERWQLLNESLSLECQFAISGDITELPSLSESYIKLEQAIPCLMHCSNHNGEKYFSTCYWMDCLTEVVQMSRWKQR